MKTTKHILAFIAILFLVILFFSCKKNTSQAEENSTSASTIVIDFNTGLPIAGKKIHLTTPKYSRLVTFSNYWKIEDADTTLIPNYYDIRDSAISNSIGKITYSNAQFQIPNTSGFTYLRPFVIDNTTILAPHPLVNGLIYQLYSAQRNFYDTIYIDRKAFFKINVHKNSPTNINDTIFHTVSFRSIIPGLFSNYNLKGRVAATDYSLTEEFPYNAYGKAIVEWRYYRNGLQNSRIDTLNLNLSGTTIYNINY